MNFRKWVPWSMRRLRGLRDDDALAITEYGVLVALIALAMVAVLTVFGPQISSWFSRKTGNITTV